MRRKRSALTLVELLVVISIIGILVSLLLPAVQYAREAARRTQCQNNLKQIGIAMQAHEDSRKRLPSGWTADVPDGEPGWSWSVEIMPYMEQRNLYRSIRRDLPIEHPANAKQRLVVLPSYLCPSEPLEAVFPLGEGEHDHGGHHHDDENPENVDEGHPLFLVARSNYVGVFGSFEIEDAPGRGDGTFFHNSRVRLGDLTDGTSNTLIVGERSSRLGGSTWTGVVHEAAAPMARVVGVADHPPNDSVDHFDDFSSYHASGAHFLLGDGSVRLISDGIDREAYRAMATRAGGEVFSPSR